MTERVVFDKDAAKLMQKEPGVGQLMRDVAEKAAARVRAPQGQTILFRGGVGRRGAFSQVIMRGPDAIFIEFGTKTRKARAPLRSVIYAMKEVVRGR